MTYLNLPKLYELENHIPIEDLKPGDFVLILFEKLHYLHYVKHNNPKEQRITMGNLRWRKDAGIPYTYVVLKHCAKMFYVGPGVCPWWRRLLLKLPGISPHVAPYSDWASLLQ